LVGGRNGDIVVVPSLGLASAAAASWIRSLDGWMVKLKCRSEMNRVADWDLRGDKKGRGVLF
jgi:hypothetical protein